jgi:hypothetical protein
VYSQGDDGAGGGYVNKIDMKNPIVPIIQTLSI